MALVIFRKPTFNILLQWHLYFYATQIITQRHLETLQGSVPLTSNRKVDPNRKHLESLRGEGPDLAGGDHVGSDNDWDYSLSDSFGQVNGWRGLGLLDGGEPISLSR